MKTRRCVVSAISGTHRWANPSASIGLCALRLTTCSVSCTTRSDSSLPHTGRKPPNWPSHATWCCTLHGNFNWLIRDFEWYCLNRRKLPNILYIWIITHKCTVINSSFLYHAGRLYHHKCLREDYKGDKMKLPIKNCEHTKEHQQQTRNKLKFKTPKVELFKIIVYFYTYQLTPYWILLDKN